MGILLKDNFDGAGSIAGHVLDIPYSGWVNYDYWSQILPATLDSGSVISTDTANTQSFGYFQINDFPGIPSPYYAKMEVTMGADISPNVDGHFGYEFHFLINGNDWVAKLNAAPSSAWFLTLVGTDETLSVDMTGLLAASTTYEIDLFLSQGSQTLTMVGQTITQTGDFYGGGPPYTLTQFLIGVGHPHRVDTFTVADSEIVPPGDAATVTADLTAPMGILDTMSLWATHLTAPFGALYSVSHDATGEREFRGTAPMGVLSARTGASARLSAPMGTLVSSVTVPVSVRASLAAPFGELSSSATVAVTVRADLRMSSAGTLTAYAGAVAALSAPPGVLNAVATAGVMAYFAGGAPMGVLSAAMSSGIVVRAELVAPMMTPTPSMHAELVAPMGRLDAVARAVVTITYEAYAVNLKPGNRAGKHEVTHYTNWPFDGIVRHGSRYYAWGPSGLFLLGGTTDDGDADISWSWKTAITDFKSPMGKNVPAGIIRGRIGPSVTASVSVGERADKTYAAQIIRGQNAQNHRVKFGRGTDDTYYSFGLAGTGQGDVTELALDVIEHKRRI